MKISIFGKQGTIQTGWKIEKGKNFPRFTSSIFCSCCTTKGNMSNKTLFKGMYLDLKIMWL